MGNVEIPKWLKDLPLAPEFYPTDTEFADPIAYISKIEKKASAFGICKIIPPLPKPSKRYVFTNLNKSLSKCPELGDGVNFSNGSCSLNTCSGDVANDGESRAVFTTRHQELGQGIKKTKGMVKENPQLGVHKQVWQSGEIYTLDQFELKSKAFAKGLLGLIKDINPLVVEALFWKATSEKPIYVEYANDVPGSGFGEPEGQFRYFHRRRRKRASYKSYRRSTGNFDCKDSEKYSVHNSCSDEMRSATIKNDLSMSSQIASRSPTASSTSFSEESMISSKRKSVNASNDVEGTAGWKLSNSPWNLQVIARSPGSLTRFMPDDIPGVTSPMVYIGMLFSWFAWHVEDHELHSMNFLHTGSPKTWYSVPGDYAFAFEEVIRTEAYGGGIDRLAALSLLGEKTTLLSPELIVSSGIPCCRLVQNPGEFVVTFPRAYHVGFSHGFNCGEAANFGTPQWLKVAKEAAIRRAAMNYLPMLSHQQLLYLLTMSFVSRVPRSLLPGARSSRLRDRLKEERELSVKKAFIEDMLKENNILSALLVKDSTYNAVIWNPDLLPSSNKDSHMTSIGAGMTEENDYHAHSKDSSEATVNDLFKEMSMYMESLNDLYVEDDDISGEFQVDSGALACVACGILGFPFMSVVQPSQRASEELLPQHHPLVQEESRVEKFETCPPAAVDGSSKGSVPDLPMPRGWNNSSKFLRPRIFCLEHGVQIAELLESKGGANMRVICHSDYQKIKAHAATIAEDIATPFNFVEVPLEGATQEDLNVICLAIDDEDNDELGEDWTSKLGINLRYCVKVRKNSPSNKVQHALALGGLFSDETNSDFLSIKWKSRRSRSRIKLNRRIPAEQSKRVERHKGGLSGMMSKDVNVKKEEKFIQYARRKYRVKIECSTSWGQGFPWKQSNKEVSVANCEDLVKRSGIGSESSPCSIGISGSELPEVLHEVQVLEATEEMNLMSTSLHVTCSNLTASAAVERVVTQVEHQPSEELHENNNVWNASACGGFKIRHDKVNGEIGANEDSSAKEFYSQHVTAAHEIPKVQGEYQTVDEVTSLANPVHLHVSNKPLEQIENTVSEKSCIDSVVVADMSCMNIEVCDLGSATLDDKMIQICQIPGKRNGNHYESSSDQLYISVEERTACPQETCAAKDKLQNKVEITNVVCEKLVPSNVRMTHDLKPVCPDESSQISRQPCVASDFCNVTLEKGMQQDMQATYESNKEIDQRSAVSGEGFTTIIGGISAKDDLCPGTDSVSNMPLSTSESKVEGFVPNTTTRIHDPSVPVPLEKYSETPIEGCASDAMSVDLNLETRLQKEIHSDVMYSNVEGCVICQTTSEEEPPSSHVTQIIEQTPVLTRCCFQTEEESCSTGNLQKGLEDCSSHDLESTESAMVDPRSTARKGKKRRNELEQLSEDKLGSNGFIKSPCEGLRPRAGKDVASKNEIDIRKSIEENPVAKKARKSPDTSIPGVRKKEITKRSHKCDIDGCTMSFETKAELQLHKRNRCPYEGCRKRFNSHKYAIIHQRVHEDDRPLKCPWKGCSMSFKWAWARTEHIRVHTGEKPYKCKVEGCGRSFRFVSDFSRHRRKTGHYVNTPA